MILLFHTERTVSDERGRQTTRTEVVGINPERIVSVLPSANLRIPGTVLSLTNGDIIHVTEDINEVLSELPD